MISWITALVFALGSACAAIVHRLCPGWTTTGFRLRYTADAVGPLRAASARVAPAIHAMAATSSMTAITSADTTIRPRRVSLVRERVRALADRGGAGRAARRGRSPAAGGGAAARGLGAPGAAARRGGTKVKTGVPGCWPGRPGAGRRPGAAVQTR
jgi:hypothetical protein